MQIPQVQKVGQRELRQTEITPSTNQLDAGKRKKSVQSLVALLALMKLEHWNIPQLINSHSINDSLQNFLTNNFYCNMKTADSEDNSQIYSHICLETKCSYTDNLTYFLVLCQLRWNVN